MQVRDPTRWMWGESLAALERAERLQPRRTLAPDWRHGRIHLLELPYGERRIELPLHPLSLGLRSHRDGCLLLVFDKPGASP